MQTRYILINRARSIKEVEAYLYEHTKIIGQLSPGTRLYVLLEMMAVADNADYLVNYQADRLASGLIPARVFETFEEAAAAMLTEAGNMEH